LSHHEPAGVNFLQRNQAVADKGTVSGQLPSSTSHDVTGLELPGFRLVLRNSGDSIEVVGKVLG
jgi:hypothetical protein